MSRFILALRRIETDGLTILCKSFTAVSCCRPSICVHRCGGSAWSPQHIRLITNSITQSPLLRSILIWLNAGHSHVSFTSPANERHYLSLTEFLCLRLQSPHTAAPLTEPQPESICVACLNRRKKWREKWTSNGGRDTFRIVNAVRASHQSQQAGAGFHVAHNTQPRNQTSIVALARFSLPASCRVFARAKGKLRSLSKICKFFVFRWTKQKKVVDSFSRGSFYLGFFWKILLKHFVSAFL